MSILTEIVCVIHTHTKFGNLLTQLIKGNEFRISMQEMIQGCENRQTKQKMDNVDTLVVPIIPTELNEFLLCVIQTNIYFTNLNKLWF